jgi:hypothetical protein
MLLERLALIAFTCALVPACSPSEPARDPAADSRIIPLRRLAGSWERTWPEARGAVTMLIDEGGEFSWRAEPRGGIMCRFAGRVAFEAGGDALGYLSITLSSDTCREKLVYRSFKLLELSADSMALAEDTQTGGDGQRQVFRRKGSAAR